MQMLCLNRLVENQGEKKQLNSRMPPALHAEYVRLYTELSLGEKNRWQIMAAGLLELLKLPADDIETAVMRVGGANSKKAADAFDKLVAQSKAEAAEPYMEVEIRDGVPVGRAATPAKGRAGQPNAGRR